MIVYFQSSESIDGNLLAELVDVLRLVLVHTGQILSSPITVHGKEEFHSCCYSRSQHQ